MLHISVPLNRRPELLDSLKRIGNSLVRLYGKRCEIAIHDFADLKSSLICQYGNVTGRSLGAPVSTRLFQLLKQFGNDVADQYNYRMRVEGDRIIRSTTTFIRDEGGSVIGCFCVNHDVTDMLKMRDMLDDMDSFNEAVSDESEKHETTPAELIEKIVLQGAAIVGHPPALMSKKERLVVIGMLENNGVFHTRGAVELVAGLLGVTRFTIYNYLKENKQARKMNL